MGYLYSVGPTQEPFTVDDVKAHLHVDFDDDDAYISMLIKAARWKLERQYRRAFLTQTLILGLDAFAMPERIRDVQFPVSWWPPAGYQSPLNSIITLRPPVQSITTIKYYDPSLVLQTVSSVNYMLDVGSEPNRVSPTVGKVWPATATIPGAVQVTFVAGATSPDLVTENIKLALMLVIGNFYANREETVIGTRLVALQLPDGVDKLMAPYSFPMVR